MDNIKKDQYSIADLKKDAEDKMVIRIKDDRAPRDGQSFIDGFMEGSFHGYGRAQSEIVQLKEANNILFQQMSNKCEEISKLKQEKEELTLFVESERRYERNKTIQEVIEAYADHLRNTFEYDKTPFSKRLESLKIK